MGLANAMTAVELSLLADSFVHQTLLVGAVLTTLVWRLGKIPRLQVVAWSILLVFLYARFGDYGQLTFYSNDQLHHAGLVDRLLEQGPPTEVQWWFSTGRIPYVLPATLLAAAGLNSTLALKTVALLSYLYITQLFSNVSPRHQGNRRLVEMYLCSLGIAGLFFATLALRETTMMLCVAIFLLHSSPRIRFITLFALLLLRPHLAAALLVGWSLAEITRHVGRGRWSPVHCVSVIAVGTTIGYFLFSFGLWLGTGQSDTIQHRGGIEPVTRVVSNLVGLQFLTAQESTVPTSIASLLGYRVFLSETIVIPTIFLVVTLLSTRLSDLGRIVLWSFSIYLGLVTNTEFNSFRQNIPFMPMMGLVVLTEFERRRSSYRVSPPPPNLQLLK